MNDNKRTSDHETTCSSRPMGAAAGPNSPAKPPRSPRGGHIAAGLALFFAGILLFTGVALGEDHMDHDMDMDDDMVKSGDIAPGESWSHTFGMHGEFHYHCMNHPDHMEAMITIAMAGEDHEPQEHTVMIEQPDEQDLDTWSFMPMHLTIHAGDTITWVNEGSVVHNVMEEHDDHEMDMSGDRHDDDPEPYIPAPAIGFVVMIVAILVLVRRL